MKKTITITFLTFLTSSLITGCTPKDTTAPEISLNITSLELEVGDVFNEMDYPRAYDDVDGDITDSITVKESNVNTEVPGTYSITYEIINAAKLGAITTLDVTVVEGITDYDTATIAAIDELRGILKKPESLEIYEASVIEYTESITNDLAYIVALEYSAQNGFGGSNRDDIYIAIKAETMDASAGNLDGMLSALNEIVLDGNKEMFKIYMNQAVKIDLDKIL